MSDPFDKATPSQVCHLSLFDGQKLEFPKLGRQNLTAAEVGFNKGVGLARRLAGIHPRSAIVGFPVPVPVPSAPATALVALRDDMIDPAVDVYSRDRRRVDLQQVEEGRAQVLGPLRDGRTSGTPR